jgi:hypothetical protein
MSSTNSRKTTASKAVSFNLRGIPNELSEKLIEEFLEIKRHFSRHHWGASQLNGGRFAEVVLRIFQHLLNEQVTAFGTDIPNTKKTSILNAVQSHTTIDDHVRQKTVPIVRMLLDFRNNRDSAHLGGFDANSIDTVFVMTGASWVLCELLRVYCDIPMDRAQNIVDGLAVKEYPGLMEFEGELYIARHDLKPHEEVLVCLYGFGKTDYQYLFSKSRQRNTTRFREMLEKLILEKYVGIKGDEYFLMPRGFKTVENEQLLQYRD